MARHRNRGPERGRPAGSGGRDRSPGKPQPSPSRASQPGSAPPSPQPSRPAHARAAPAHHERGAPPGQAWLYGQHAVLAALANPFRECRRLLLTRELAQRLEGALAEAAGRRGAPLIAPEIVDRQALDARLPPGAVHQGIALLVAPLPERDIEEIVAAEQDLVLVLLDQVTDPHNVGAILRSADAFGAAAVVVTDRHAPEETGVLAKAASGALERVPLIRVVNLARAMDQLKAKGFWCLGLAGEADGTLAEARPAGRVALVLGAEGDGMRRLTREHCDLLVRLPMRGAMPSLNVSNAAAVALYEVTRGRP